MFAMALMSVSPVYAQSSRVTYVVGFAVVKPDIDGRWESNEWVYSNELQLTRTPASAASEGDICDGEVYLRMTHDNSSLFGIIDVDSDFGATWQVGNTTYIGSATFLFNGNNDGIFQNDVSDYVVGLSPGYTNASVYSTSFSAYASQVVAAVSGWTSPHSSLPHRIYEFSIPLKPLIKYAPIESGEPVIGFDLIVVYGKQGVCDVMGRSTLPAELIFSPIAVPENVDLLLPLFVCLTIIFLRKPKIKVRSAETD
jgi:hypothetical protein